MRNPFLLLAASLLLVPLTASAQPPGGVTIDCGNGGTWVMGINDAGQVVGFTGDNPIESAKGFVLDRHSGVCQPLEPPDGWNAIATLPAAINDRGQVVGFYVQPGGDTHRFRAFLWDRGQWTQIDYLRDSQPVCQTSATGINNRGQIVGFFDYCEPNQAVADHPYLRDADGVMTELPNPGSGSAGAGSINARGDIIGTCCGQSSPHTEDGYLRAKGALSAVVLTHPDYKQVFPTAIDAAGDIVGVLNVEWQDFPIGPSCFGFYRPRGGEIRPLDTMGMCTIGINAAGDISGTYFENGQPHGFIVPKASLLREP